jgi:hypothetical protein
MAAPYPFTFSSLETFINCPRRYHEQYVLKSVKDEQGPQAAYGDMVHGHFENYINASGDYALPKDLEPHKAKLDNLLSRDGIFWAEDKVALNKKLEPCRYDDPDRLWRGKIDFRLVHRTDHSALLTDYKTGKKHEKWAQLGIYALHTFAAFPSVNLINAQFYWTKDQTTTKKVWGRGDIEAIWNMFVADLRQYKEAFKTDTWQERPSGLCRGWCPVKQCQHWRPKREF